MNMDIEDQGQLQNEKEIDMAAAGRQAFGESAVRVHDLGGVQMARLRFGDDGEPLLEIADPPGEGGSIQWIVIGGRRPLVRLAHGILEFMLDYPDESDVIKIP